MLSPKPPPNPHLVHDERMIITNIFTHGNASINARPALHPPILIISCGHWPCHNPRPLSHPTRCIFLKISNLRSYKTATRQIISRHGINFTCLFIITNLILYSFTKLLQTIKKKGGRKPTGRISQYRPFDVSRFSDPVRRGMIRKYNGFTHYGSYGSLYERLIVLVVVYTTYTYLPSIRQITTKQNITCELLEVIAQNWILVARDASFSPTAL